jgi:hypothetical protein
MQRTEPLVLNWCAAAHQCSARLWTEQRARAHHEGLGGSRGLAPHILNLNINGAEWPASHSSRLNTVGLAPEPFWTFWRSAYLLPGFEPG